MSRLDELIAELCPDGVKYCRLDSICDIYDGTHQTPKYVDSGIKFVSVENVSDPFGTNKFISEQEFNSFRIKPQLGDVLMTRIGSIGICAVIDRDEPLAYYVSLALLRPNADCVGSKFLKYAIESIHGRKELRKWTLINAVPIKINTGDIGRVTIPVPPLPVQQEIVRILDSFSELTAELTAELATRKKQYEYYASELFSISSAEITPLSQLASFSYGYTDTAKSYGDTRFIRITDIDEQGHLKEKDQKYITITEDARQSLLSPGDLVMARTGATYGKTLYYESDYPSVYASFLIKIMPDNSKIINRYYWHFTKTPLYWEQAKKLVTTGGQPQFNTPAIKQVKVPVPPIS